MSRTRHTDREKARIIREFKNHQGSTADFCRRRGISSQTFTNWRRRAKASLASKDESLEFLEFELGATRDRQAPSGPLIELELGGGMVLRILPARTKQP
jgi:transposase-like protein